MDKSEFVSNNLSRCDFDSEFVMATKLCLRITAGFFLIISSSLTIFVHIDKHNLLPPLLVVQLLSKNSMATLSVIKEFILRRIREDGDVAKEYEESIAQFREETDAMKKHIDELKTRYDKVFMVKSNG